MTLVDRTAAELLADLNSKRVSSVEVTQAFIDQIEKHDDQVKAFLALRRPRRLLSGLRKSTIATPKGQAVGLLGGRCRWP